MSSPDQWLENAIIFGVYPAGGGGGGGVTAKEVQEFAFNREPASGVDDAFIVTLSPVVTVLTDGLMVGLSSGSLQNNTTSPTLQINALTPVDIVLWGGAVAPGDIQPNASYLFIYNAALNTFELINPSVSTANTFLVQSGFYNSGIDTGAANAYVLTLQIPPVGSFGIGFPVYMRVGAGNDNTGASTLAVNGSSAEAITLTDGSALPAGAMLGNRMALLLYNGTGWTLINPVITPEVVNVSGTTQVLSPNTIYFFNNAAATTGALPASGSVSQGDLIKIKGRSSAPFIIQANTGQTIKNGATFSSVAGTLTSAAGTDTIQFSYDGNDEWSVDFSLSSLLNLA